ncbi:uncharacterized protein BJ171DRAFT_514667 [Polychytrium aggregatum]|uniref:uncharacterized protein n=1 Tax=Polychytrium aggregatum TaxID=110093 RepID=UPI0022FF2901|nr:uncharacterized protein BJ171DRAFT_514667 [Polychytrium aggregatum]KAI9202296.1 hypothetical protein BJ171DRAFT_514667 [Polychytrium aggregatum]
MLMSNAPPESDDATPNLGSIIKSLDLVSSLLNSSDNLRQALHTLCAVMDSIVENVESLGLVPHPAPASDQSALLPSSVALPIPPILTLDTPVSALAAVAAAAAVSAATASIAANPRALLGPGPATEGDPSQSVALSYEDQLEFWDSINDIWLLTIRSGTKSLCVGTLVTPQLTDGALAGAEQPSHPMNAADASTSLPPSPSTTLSNQPSIAEQTDVVMTDAISSMTTKDWAAIRESVNAWADVLEWYGLVDYQLGFAEEEIVQAIDQQILNTALQDGEPAENSSAASS